MRIRSILLTTAILAATFAAASAETGCAAAAHAGGDWPSYGRDLKNTRHQPAETTIDAARAQGLTMAWVAPAAAIGDDGTYSSTPVIANGCVYIGSNTGMVVALNADTGQLVWKRQLEVAQPGGNGGAIVGSVAYTEGRVIVLVNQLLAPYAVSLDANTGDEQWKTVVDTDHVADYANASPVIFDGMLFYAMSGPDSGSDYAADAHQRYYILDVQTGEVILEKFIISQRDYDNGHRGGSIWATPAIDEQTGYLYVGTGNPVSRRFEHKYDNAIVKIDLDRDRSTFGQIVDAYKGETDNYTPALYDQAVCQATGDDQTTWYGGGYSATCAQLDVDFGASPTLWTDRNGDTVVGEFQKSGVFHAAYGDTLQGVWRSIISVPSAIGNAGSSATDGTNVFVAANPGALFALDLDNGAPAWAAPTADGVRYQSVSSANGVVYTVDTKGFFDAYDATTGAPLLHWPMRVDTGESITGMSSNGVAIARNTVYVAAGGFVIAYR